MQYYKEMGGSGLVDTRISNREDEYKQRRMARTLSPERGDAFGGKTPVRTYKDIMAEQELKNEKEQVRCHPPPPLLARAHRPAIVCAT